MLSAGSRQAVRASAVARDVSQCGASRLLSAFRNMHAHALACCERLPSSAADRPLSDLPGANHCRVRPASLSWPHPPPGAAPDSDRGTGVPQDYFVEHTSELVEQLVLRGFEQTFAALATLCGSGFVGCLPLTLAGPRGVVVIDLLSKCCSEAEGILFGV